MMISSLFLIAFILFLFIALIIFLFWKSSGGSVPAGGVKGVDITETPDSSLKKWDCSINNRQLIFSNVPDGLTPYLVPFDENALRSQKLEGFRVLLSIAADVRFRDKDSKEIEKFESPVTVWMSYNAQDLLALRKTDYKITDLVPVKIVPGSTNWKPFPAEKLDYSNLDCGGYGGVSIIVDSWGDPPMGWGSPKSL